MTMADLRQREIELGREVAELHRQDTADSRAQAAALLRELDALQDDLYGNAALGDDSADAFPCAC